MNYFETIFCCSKLAAGFKIICLHVHFPTLLCACVLSHVWLFVTPWTVALQAPLSMGFSRQEYWSGLPRSPPGDLPNPGIKPASLTFLALAGRFFTTSTTWEAHSHCIYMYHVFFIHSSVSGHLDCFHVLGIVNSAAVNIEVHAIFLN